VRRGGQHYNDGKKDDPDTVVEEALAGDLGLQSRRHMNGLQNTHDRDRVGRRNQGAEDQAIEQRDAKAQQA
jgi:hypothetical protein